MTKQILDIDVANTIIKLEKGEEDLEATLAELYKLYKCNFNNAKFQQLAAFSKGLWQQKEQYELTPSMAYRYYPVLVFNTYLSDYWQAQWFEYIFTDKTVQLKCQLEHPPWPAITHSLKLDKIEHPDICDLIWETTPTKHHKDLYYQIPRPKHLPKKLDKLHPEILHQWHSEIPPKRYPEITDEQLKNLQTLTGKTGKPYRKLARRRRQKEQKN